MEGSASMGGELNDALTQNVKPTTLISEYKSIAPWIGLMISASFVLYKVSRMLKGAGKGKVRA